jgi:hypothetical protein
VNRRHRFQLSNDERLQSRRVGDGEQSERMTRMPMAACNKFGLELRETAN